MRDYRTMKDCLYCDCETNAERAEFFASGRAVETGVISAALAPDVARAFAMLIEPEEGGE